MTDKKKHVATYNTQTQTNQTLIQRVFQLCREDGLVRVLTGVKDFVKWRWRSHLSNPFYVWYYKRLKKDTFVFDGTEHDYFYHRYNETWSNERAVEIPIIYEIVRSNPDKRTLEVGNVLSHYFDLSHTVVDKYEQGDDIINEDIVTYDPAEDYDLIISISTLEHVGWDEEAAEPEKIQTAFENIRSLLAEDGVAVITLPLGYNTYLDGLLRSDQLFSEKKYMKRVTKDNRWTEVEDIDVTNAQFGEPYNGANELLIGKIS